MPYVFLSKNKGFKKKLFSYLLRRKKKEKIFKKKKEKIKRKFPKKTQRQKKKSFARFYKKYETLSKSIDEVLKNHKGKEKERIGFFFKKRFLWLKKRFYTCLVQKKFHRYFKRFRIYRYLYKHYTEARLYESIALGRISLGEMLRLSFFPIKPMHFEFCYRRCEGVLLCSPQKWYNLSLLDPATL